MAGIGIILIVYGTVLLLTGHPESKELRAFADWISIFLTLIGVFLVALSAYFTPHARDPDEHSMKYVAPIVMLFVVGAIALMICSGTLLNQPIILGFAILSLSGATLKALPFSEQQPETFNVPMFRPWPWWRTESTKRKNNRIEP
jgi:drug/metabolite transporter (DMT)-like permease